MQRFTGSPVLTGPGGKRSGAERNSHFWCKECKVSLPVFEPSFAPAHISKSMTDIVFVYP